MIEVVIWGLGLVLLAAMLLPWLARRNMRSSRINCSNNLHQIGIAARTWALDNGDRFPSQVSVTNEGAMEFAEKGMAAPVFEVMSNELSNPKILICPWDAHRTSLAVFSNFNNSHLSYFISADADQDRPQMFLAGDRNLTTNGSAVPGGGLCVLQTNMELGWTAQMHKNVGNILLADGSAQELVGAQLRAAARNSGSTNRLAMP